MLIQVLHHVKIDLSGMSDSFDFLLMVTRQIGSVRFCVYFEVGRKGKGKEATSGEACLLLLLGLPAMQTS